MTTDAKAAARDQAEAEWYARQVTGGGHVYRDRATFGAGWDAAIAWQQAQDRERIEAQAALIRELREVLGRLLMYEPSCAQAREDGHAAAALLARAAELEAGGTV